MPPPGVLFPLGEVHGQHVLTAAPQVAIPSVIVTAKKPSKVAAERRYVRMLQKPDDES